MRTALGFATTPTSIEFVRIDGFGTDDAHVSRDSFQALPNPGDGGCDAYGQLAARVWFRMRGLARAAEHRGCPVGVTCSRGADREAALLIEALTDAGFADVVAVDVGDASRELSDHPVPWLSTVVDLGALDASGLGTSAAPQDQVAFAAGAALVAGRGVGRTFVTTGHPSRARSKIGVLAGGVALLALLSLNSGLRQTPDETPGTTQSPQLPATFGGWAVVPAPAAPVRRVPAPLPESPPAPEPAVEPEPDAVPPSPPAAVAPEPPASVAVPLPAVPAPADQLPPTVPEPPISPPPPPGPTCVLLCGVAI